MRGTARRYAFVGDLKRRLRNKVATHHERAPAPAADHVAYARTRYWPHQLRVSPDAPRPAISGYRAGADCRVDEPPGVKRRTPAEIWLLLLAGERAKEKPLG